MFGKIWKKIKPVSTKKMLKEIEVLKMHIEALSIANNKDKIFSISNFFSNKDKHYGKTYRDVKMFLPMVGTDAIQTLIFQNLNFFSLKELEKLDVWLLKFIRTPFEKRVAFDVGANIGNHSIYWSTNNCFSKIYSFEPIRETYDILTKNIQINNLENKIIPYNLGIGEKESYAKIKVYSLNNIGANQIEVLENNFEQSNIKIISLDEFGNKNAISNIDFIKIDVEGFEKQVLLGSKELIKRFKPLMLVEIFPEHFDVINEIMTSYGYVIVDKIGHADFLFIHRDKKND
ncbi:FkbM family methyltransferase [Campylobacter jejuni]|nr:FkbM family methyltransferase [Campylobacter jejuni]EAL5082356.1 hypothetical protein [Campylobacter jejuni]EDP5872795.1 FkbM family methyltransferase [Campylobacter jejuni]MBX2083217.1 FkbM family methyltransferase [Campylobacter jejuni]HED4890592.1 FkbM family methyltransferase [Campylobacter jejuni]